MSSGGFVNTKNAEIRHEKLNVLPGNPHPLSANVRFRDNLHAEIIQLMEFTVEEYGLPVDIIPEKITTTKKDIATFIAKMKSASSSETEKTTREKTFLNKFEQTILSKYSNINQTINPYLFSPVDHTAIIIRRQGDYFFEINRVTNIDTPEKYYEYMDDTTLIERTVVNETGDNTTIINRKKIILNQVNYKKINNFNIKHTDSSRVLLNSLKLIPLINGEVFYDNTLNNLKIFNLEEGSASFISTLYPNLYNLLKYYLSIGNDGMILKKSFHLLNVHLVSATLPEYLFQIKKTSEIAKKIIKTNYIDPDNFDQKMLFLDNRDEIPTKTDKSIESINIEAFPNINLKIRINEILNEIKKRASDKIDIDVVDDFNVIVDTIKELFNKISFTIANNNEITKISGKIINSLLDNIKTIFESNKTRIITFYNYGMINIVNENFLTSNIIQSQYKYNIVDLVDTFISASFGRMCVFFIIDNIELMIRYILSYIETSELSFMNQNGDKDINATKVFMDWIVLFALKNPPNTMTVNIYEQFETFYLSNNFISDTQLDLIYRTMRGNGLFDSRIIKLARIIITYRILFFRDIVGYIYDTIDYPPIIFAYENVSCPINKSIRPFAACGEFSILNIILFFIYDQKNNTIDYNKIKDREKFNTQILDFIKRNESSLISRTKGDYLNQFTDIIQNLKGIEYCRSSKGSDSLDYELEITYDNFCNLFKLLNTPGILGKKTVVNDDTTNLTEPEINASEICKIRYEKNSLKNILEEIFNVEIKKYEEEKREETVTISINNLIKITLSHKRHADVSLHKNFTQNIVYNNIVYNKNYLSKEFSIYIIISRSKFNHITTIYKKHAESLLRNYKKEIEDLDDQIKIQESKNQKTERLKLEKDRVLTKITKLNDATSTKINYVLNRIHKYDVYQIIDNLIEIPLEIPPSYTSMVTTINLDEEDIVDHDIMIENMNIINILDTASEHRVYINVFMNIINQIFLNNYARRFTLNNNDPPLFLPEVLIKNALNNTFYNLRDINLRPYYNLRNKNTYNTLQSILPGLLNLNKIKYNIFKIFANKYNLLCNYFNTTNILINNTLFSPITYSRLINNFYKFSEYPYIYRQKIPKEYQLEYYYDTLISDKPSEIYTDPDKSTISINSKEKLIKHSEDFIFKLHIFPKFLYFIQSFETPLFSWLKHINPLDKLEINLDKINSILLLERKGYSNYVDIESMNVDINNFYSTLKINIIPFIPGETSKTTIRNEEYYINELSFNQHFYLYLINRLWFNVLILIKTNSITKNEFSIFIKNYTTYIFTCIKRSIQLRTIVLKSLNSMVNKPANTILKFRSHWYEGNLNKELHLDQKTIISISPLTIINNLFDLDVLIYEDALLDPVPADVPDDVPDAVVPAAVPDAVVPAAVPDAVVPAAVPDAAVPDANEQQQRGFFGNIFTNLREYYGLGGNMHSKHQVTNQMIGGDLFKYSNEKRSIPGIEKIFISSIDPEIKSEIITAFYKEILTKADNLYGKITRFINDYFIGLYKCLQALEQIPTEKYTDIIYNINDMINLPTQDEIKESINSRSSEKLSFSQIFLKELNNTIELMKTPEFVSDIPNSSSSSSSVDTLPSNAKMRQKIIANNASKFQNFYINHNLYVIPDTFFTTPERTTLTPEGIQHLIKVFNIDDPDYIECINTLADSCSKGLVLSSSSSSSSSSPDTSSSSSVGGKRKSIKRHYKRHIKSLKSRRSPTTLKKHPITSTKTRKQH
jgi:hypothetical protein